MHWDWKKDYFCIAVGGIHMLFFFGSSPALLDYIANGYVENMAKLTICILSGLGFFALAMTTTAVHSLARQVHKDHGSLRKLGKIDRFHIPDNPEENQSISFNEPGFRKNKSPKNKEPENKAPENKAPKSVSENEDKTDGWSSL